MEDDIGQMGEWVKPKINQALIFKAQKSQCEKGSTCVFHAKSKLD